MLGLVLVCSSLVSGVDAAGREAKELAEYRAAAAAVGRDAGAHLRLALWCEAHGLSAERLRHLTIAVQLAPGQPAARGLLGQMADGGRWRTPREAAERVLADKERAETLSRYRQRREAIPDTAEAHWQLARWCRENGLEDEGRVHLEAVVRIDPGRAEAWKELGAVRRNGRWGLPEQAAQERKARDEQRKADARWGPLLQKWKGWLAEKTKRPDAEAALAGLSDPRAVPSIWRVLAVGRSASQTRAVLLLRQIDSPAASRALAALAILGESPEVRRLAAESLAGRDIREFADLWIRLLRDPISYEVRQVGGPGTPGELYVKGERLNRRLFYSAPPPLATLRPGDVVGFDMSGLPVARRVVGYTNAPLNAAIDPLYWGAPDLTGAPDILAQSPLGAAGRALGQKLVQNQHQTSAIAGSMAFRGGGGRGFVAPLVAQVPVGQLMLIAQAQAVASQQRLEQDVAALKRYNDDVNQLNERATAALRTALGEDLGTARDAWIRWWESLVRTSSAAPPPPRPGDAEADAAPSRAAEGRHSRLPSLARGTLVWTLSGRRPIEDVRAGDRLLVQDTATGTLQFAPAGTIRRHRRDAVTSLTIGDTTLLATALERLWVTGKGWVTARALEPGDPVRVLGGVERVAEVTEAGARETYHVEVPEGQGIFIGTRGILAHDGRVAQTVAAPFDAAEEPKPPRAVPGR
jgi:hypothetical protein